MLSCYRGRRHRWRCIHNLPAEDCSSGPHHCGECGVEYETVQLAVEMELARRRSERFENAVNQVMISTVLDGQDVIIATPDREYAERVYNEALSRVQRLSGM